MEMEKKEIEDRKRILDEVERLVKINRLKN
jgi:hypothetical protein